MILDLIEVTISVAAIYKSFNFFLFLILLLNVKLNYSS